jgi:hypothetical protein
MWLVIVSQVSTGSVQRRAVRSFSATYDHLDHREGIQRPTKAGLRGIRIEVAPSQR